MTRTTTKIHTLGLAIALVVTLAGGRADAQNFNGAYDTARSLAPAGPIDHGQAAVVLNAMAVALGGEWGLLRKDGGNNCAPAGVEFKVSCDWLINKATGQGCDFFGDAPGFDQQTGAPVKGSMVNAGCHLEPSPGKWVKPAPVALPTPAPTPPPAQGPPAVTRQELLDLVAALRADLVDQVEELRTAIGRKADQATLEAAVAGVLDRLTRDAILVVEGRTETRGAGPFTHSHAFAATVKKR